MNIRLLAIVFICVAAPAIAFPLGIRVGSGWNGKVGPGASGSDGARRAQLHPVRVIQPGTLDGQSIPGNAGRPAGSARDLSPIYPTTRSAERDLAASQGLAPAIPTPDSEAMPGAGDIASATEASAEPPPPARHHDRYVYAHRHHSWRREASTRPRHGHLAARATRPSNPITAIAGLFFR
jgi:hypothetical protein